MLISSYQERYARSTEKIRVLLNFLKEETYSDFQIIKLLFDFKSDRPLPVVGEGGENGADSEARA